MGLSQKKEKKGNKMANQKKVDQVQDYDVPKDAQGMQEQMALYMEQYNRNVVELAGKVISKNEGEAKPKIDKKTGEPVVVDGIPQFWEPFRSCEVIFEGGSININLDAKNFDNVVVGKRYLFCGVMGLSFGRVQPVFHSITGL